MVYFSLFFLGRAGVHLGCSQDTIPHFAFATQAPPDGIQNIIWAFSRTAPGSVDANVDIRIHHAFGRATLNMTRTAAAAPPPSDDTGGNGNGNGSTPTPSDDAASDASESEPIMPRLARFVHAGFCMAAFLLVIPSGALVVRYAKLTGSPAAFDLHRNLQFGVGAFASGPLVPWTFPLISLSFFLFPIHVGID